MRRETTNDLSNIFFLVDVLVTVLTFAGSFWARNTFIAQVQPLHLSSHLFILPLILVLTTGALNYFGGYRSPYDTRFSGYLLSILKTIFVAVSILLALLFFALFKEIIRRLAWMKQPRA